MFGESRKGNQTRRMTVEIEDVSRHVGGGEEGPLAPRSSRKKEARTGVASISRAEILKWADRNSWRILNDERSAIWNSKAPQVRVA